MSEVGERARFLARQGVSYIIADPTRVVDDQMNDVSRDAREMGEVVMRGNNVMKGYFDNEAATEEAFRGGFFHSGDVAVWHPDHVRSSLAGLKAPDEVDIVPELPKTSTGKVQNYVLREKQWVGPEHRPEAASEGRGLPESPPPG